MIDIIYTSVPMSDCERNELLYNGSLIVFKQIPGMLEVNCILDRMIRENFGNDPMRVVSKCPDLFDVNMKNLQKDFRNNRDVLPFFKLALGQSGMDLGGNYADSLFLRCVPPIPNVTNLTRGKIGVHRDTWGSNIQQQINWWSSVYSLTEANTIVFYPKYWQTPVSNDTDNWSYEAFCAARTTAMLSDRPSCIEYPYAPSATQELQSSDAVSVVVNPGDILCFSSAHLHASTPDPEKYSRFNIELRSFTGRDVRDENDSEPRNIDNAQVDPKYEWFKCLRDGSDFHA
ncbi:hypothetical protein IOQ59_13315 [Pontibacterium sp. N1Y112]|uniref:Uncharacterized protein n=1 Tax=Pontibacterium sinense TaxID=2781979 RepID=A0A8J7FVP5_9GAMM|nr:hypothetical protein [Pontibacterium sinense]MBE9398235.1 hypothetical protein [Pontibacterium sinense]